MIGPVEQPQHCGAGQRRARTILAHRLIDGVDPAAFARRIMDAVYYPAAASALA